VHALAVASYNTIEIFHIEHIRFWFFKSKKFGIGSLNFKKEKLGLYQIKPKYQTQIQVTEFEPTIYLRNQNKINPIDNSPQI
jgi:hypothetical protein